VADFLRTRSHQNIDEVIGVFWLTAFFEGQCLEDDVGHQAHDLDLDSGFAPAAEEFPAQLELLVVVEDETGSGDSEG
jgi:hypothetical protein